MDIGEEGGYETRSPRCVSSAVVDTVRTVESMPSVNRLE